MRPQMHFRSAQQDQQAAARATVPQQQLQQPPSDQRLEAEDQQAPAQQPTQDIGAERPLEQKDHHFAQAQLHEML